MSQIKLFQEMYSRMTCKERNCPHEQISKTQFPGLVSCGACGYVATKKVFRLIRKLTRWPRIVVTGIPTARQVVCAETGHPGDCIFRGVGEVRGIVHRLYECSSCKVVMPKDEFKRAVRKAREIAQLKDRFEGRGTAGFASVKPLWGSD